MSREAAEWAKIVGDMVVWLLTLCILGLIVAIPIKVAMWVIAL